MISSWNVGPWNVQILPDTDTFEGPIPPPGTHTGNIIAAADSTPPHAAGGFAITSQEIAAVRTADCLPLVVASDTQGVIVHISRKSLVNTILEHIAEHVPATEARYAWLGPHICGNHFGFEYEGDEIIQFANMFPEATKKEGGTTYLSLRAATTQWLEQYSNNLEVVIDTKICTYESEMPSWRRWREIHGDVRPFPQFISILQTAQRTHV
ncbi:MAG: laccase domain-containing protein [Candidatus Andersenbacteria bacterium]